MEVTRFVFVVYRVTLGSSGIVGNSFYQFPSPPSLSEINKSIEESIQKELGEEPKEIVITNLQFFDEESYKILVSP